MSRAAPAPRPSPPRTRTHGPPGAHPEQWRRTPGPAAGAAAWQPLCYQLPPLPGPDRRRESPGSPATGGRGLGRGAREPRGAAGARSPSRYPSSAPRLAGPFAAAVAPEQLNSAPPAPRSSREGPGRGTKVSAAGTCRPRSPMRPALLPGPGRPSWRPHVSVPRGRAQPRAGLSEREETERRAGQAYPRAPRSRGPAESAAGRGAPRERGARGRPSRGT